MNRQKTFGRLLEESTRQSWSAWSPIVNWTIINLYTIETENNRQTGSANLTYRHVNVLGKYSVLDFSTLSF